jgi:O-antigen ligase
MVGILAGLYFPILDNVDLGAVEFSVTTIPVLGLAVQALFRSKRAGDSRLLRPRQWLLLALLLLAFVFPTLASFMPAVSLRLLPNLVLYAVILFGVLAHFRRPGQLIPIAKACLSLHLILSVWKMLHPIRQIFGWPGLLSNQMMYAFHPGFALSLVILLTPLEGFSRRWRIVAWLVLGVTLLWDISYEARAGLIAGAAMLLAAAIGLRSRRLPVLAFAAALLVSLGSALFPDRVQSAIDETSRTVAALTEETYAASAVSSDDLIRLVAADAAWEMFRQRPLTGWGPNLYPELKPEFASAPNFRFVLGSTGQVTGAFNSWLLALAELGLFSTLLIAALFLLPLLLAWRRLRQPAPAPGARLAFAFGLGVFGLGVHLYFVGLLYGSFSWFFVAIAWAAVAAAVKTGTAGVDQFE